MKVIYQNRRESGNAEHGRVVSGARSGRCAWEAVEFVPVARGNRFCVAKGHLYNPRAPRRRSGICPGKRRRRGNGVSSMHQFLRPLPLAAACIALALALAAGCSHHEDRIAPFHPRALQQDEREASRGAPMRPTRPLPTTLESPFANNANGAATRPTVPPATGQAIGADEPFVRIPLRDIIQRAVANSLDVKVAGYQPAIDETRVTEAEARFDPTFFTNFSYAVDRQLAPTPQNAFLQTGNEVVFRTYDMQVGVRQDLESGGKVELRYEPRYTRRSPPFPINPFWTSELTLQITQPLLRDFGADVNRARITINKNNQRISLLDFRDALEKNLADIEEAYWNLVEAELDVRIFEELLSRTQTTGKILWERRNQDVGRVQIS